MFGLQLDGGQRERALIMDFIAVAATAAAPVAVDAYAARSRMTARWPRHHVRCRGRRADIRSADAAKSRVSRKIGSAIRTGHCAPLLNKLSNPLQKYGMER